MTTYKLTGENYVIKDGETKVPIANTPEFPNTNPDYLAYKAWLAAGGVPEPADALPTPIPATCTRRQGRLALLQAGYLAAVEQSIAVIADPAQRMAAQIEYEADTWGRDNAFLQGMWAQLGGTAEQLDDLFALAVTL